MATGASGSGTSGALSLASGDAEGGAAGGVHVAAGSSRGAAGAPATVAAGNSSASGKPGGEASLVGGAAGVEGSSSTAGRGG